MLDESKQNLKSVAALMNKWGVYVEGADVMLGNGFRPSEPDADLAARVVQLKERCVAAGFPIIGADNEGEVEAFD